MLELFWNLTRGELIVIIIALIVLNRVNIKIEKRLTHLETLLKKHLDES